MKAHRPQFNRTPLLLTAILTSGAIAFAQSPGATPAQSDGPPPQIDGGFPPPGAPPFDGPPPFAPGRFGPGPGGPGGFMRQDRELVHQFDQDGDERLNAAERQAAREFLRQEQDSSPGWGGPRRGFGRRGGPPGFFDARGADSPPEPGQPLAPDDVKNYPATPFYDSLTLRTLFLQFENEDWEQELADFNNTDVEVPATLIIDGKTYSEVGVHFRGNTSNMMVPEGRKRPLNLSLDFVNKDQEVQGYHTLNLLNAHEDPTFMHTVLAFDIAREMCPAPKANFVRVVINGENWGVYVSSQQVNKTFIDEWFGTKKGDRWKVVGSPGGRGGLSYLGDDPEPYRRIYTIKSKDDPEAWNALIALCKTLNSTPVDQLKEALEPLLDIDGTLRFLAWDNAVANNDGFWVRASDYYLYRDKKGRFHFIPHDANETFSSGGGPGGFRGPPGGFAGPRGFGPGRPGPQFGPQPETAAGSPGAPPRVDPRRGRRGPGSPGGPRFGGPGGGGVNLDPLVAANDPSKPLLSKMLAVPSLRAQYLAYVHDIAEHYLDWSWLGSRVRAYRALIADDLKADTRKLDSFEAFEAGTADDPVSPADAGERRASLRSFVDQRRTYLLKATAG